MQGREIMEEYINQNRNITKTFNKIILTNVLFLLFILTMNFAIATLNNNDVIEYYGFQQGNTTHFYDSARNITYVKIAGGNYSTYNGNIYLNTSKYWSGGDVWFWSKNVSNQQNITVSFWFNLSSTSSNAGDLIDFVAGSYEYIIGTNTITGACGGAVTQGTLALCKYTGSWAQTLNIGNYTFNGVNHLAFTFEYATSTSVNAKMFINGNNTFNFTITMTAGSALNRMDMRRAGGVPTAYMDEVAIFNTSLNNTQIQELYNSGNITLYPFVAPSSPSIAPSYYVNTSQVPSDINSTLIGSLLINATITNLTTNNTVTNNSYAQLYYNLTLNTTCAIFYDGVCVNNGSTRIINMTKINNTYYTTTLNEKDIFPAYYPFDENYIENSNTLNYTLYLNNNIRFIINNFTTYINPFISIEFNIDNVSASSQLFIYYCNSSYNTGNPSSNNNCELVDTYVQSTLTDSHRHNNTKHVVQPINIRNITKTQNSSIIFYSTQTSANGWTVAYVLNSTYSNNSFKIGNPNTWSNTPNIFDIHIHQFLQTDSFRYNVLFNDGINNTNRSLEVIDYYNVRNHPPTSPFIYLPNESQKITISMNSNTSILFAWTPSFDFENSSLTYTLYAQNQLFTYDIITNLSTTNNSYLWSTNRNYIMEGSYSTRILVCDNASNCNLGSGFMTLCVNDYVRNVEPCVNDARLIDYTDVNGCDALLDVPADNGTYETCQTIVYTQRTYTEFEIVMIVLIIFLILSTFAGIFVHPAFLGLAGLICAFMIVVFQQHNMPIILDVAAGFMCLVYMVGWFLMKRMKN